MTRVRPTGPAVALRLVRSGPTIELLTKHKLYDEAPVPPVLRPSVPEIDPVEFGGFWYELRAGPTLLYRATGSDPMQASVEAFGSNGLSRIQRKGLLQQFTLLAPLSAVLAANSLLIYSLELAVCETLNPNDAVFRGSIAITTSDLI